MAHKKSDLFIKYSSLFSKSLPNSAMLVLILALLSVIAGIAAISLIHVSELHRLPYILAGGTLTGIMALLLPTLFTAFIIKAFRPRLALKYVLFIAMIAEVYYMLFIVVGGVLYMFTSVAAFSSTLIILGDASIFGWWVFVNKVVFGDRKKAIVSSVVQPTMNLLMYLPSSTFIFALGAPLGSLLLKLYGGIAIFAIVSYLAMYVFEKPIKGGLGFSGIDTFSQMLQNWLFDFTITVPKYNNRFGVKTTIATHTIVIKNASGKTKAIFFMPEVHFGPAGVMGGSNFPYALERYASMKYRAPLFVMHGAVNEDYNPISDTEFSQISSALDRSIADAKTRSAGFGERYFRSVSNSASVSIIDLACASIVTLSRAPRITEDVEPSVALVFSKMLESRFRNPVLVDAHNTRYESAPKPELAGVRFNSDIMTDYISAINSIGKPLHRSSKVKFGAASIKIYKALGMPRDLAPGALKVGIFSFNGFKKAIILFNANNMLPSLREEIIKHARAKFGVDAEVYTTDTHYVNSLRENAGNVLGRKTGFGMLKPFIDRAIEGALHDIENSRVYYSMQKVDNFAIWGASSRERIRVALESTLSIARMLIPVIIVVGLLLAAWVISLL